MFCLHCVFVTFNPHIQCPVVTDPQTQPRPHLVCQWTVKDNVNHQIKWWNDVRNLMSDSSLWIFLTKPPTFKAGQQCFSKGQYERHNG